MPLNLGGVLFGMKDLLRYVLAFLTLPILFFPSELFHHFHFHISGSLAEGMVIGNWTLVVFNILVFTAFLIPLGYRRRADWRERGLVAAFFTSLFIEMYGLPLVIFFIAGALIPSSPKPEAFLIYPLLGEYLALTVGMVYGLLLILFGALLIILGWVTLYRNRKTSIVKSGIYSISRHPQYLGFMLVVFGWWIGWPTILTSLTAPILIYKYYSVCRTEERELLSTAGYKQYIKKTRMLA
jgi:methanethiol S-methyltransferase